MIMLPLEKKNFDVDCAAAGTFIEKFAEDHPPKITIDNDGIGSYEYWGAKGYDHGTNYAEIEDNGPYKIGVDLSGYTEDEREDFLSGFDGEYLATLTEEIECKRGNGVYVDLRFLVKVGEKVGDIVTLIGEWVNKN